MFILHLVCFDWVMSVWCPNTVGMRLKCSNCLNVYGPRYALIFTGNISGRLAGSSAMSWNGPNCLEWGKIVEIVPTTTTTTLVDKIQALAAVISLNHIRLDSISIYFVAFFWQNNFTNLNNQILDFSKLLISIELKSSGEEFSRR